MNTPHTNNQVADSFAAEGFLRAVVETAVDCIITINTSGIIEHANPATQKLFGYTREEVLGKNVSMLMPPPYQNEHDGYLANYLRTKHRRIIGIGRQVTARKKDGTLIPVDLAASEANLDGKKYFTGIIHDISEQVRAAEQIRKERDFSRSLIDTAHAIILVLDPRGRIERFNPYFEQLSGYSLDEAVGLNWFDTFIPDRDREAIRQLFDMSLAGTPVVNNVNAILTRSGRERIITWSGRRLTNFNGDVVGVLSVGNDITELKETEYKLVQSERLAAVGQMMTGLAHESRNALQRSQACLEMLELDIGEDQQQVELIHRAKKALSELQRLYEEVRNYAAPIRLERRDCQLSQLVLESWKKIQVANPTPEISLQLDFDARADAVSADPERLEQVFRNLLENAIAVSPLPGIIFASSHRIALEGRPAVQVRIRDQGPGMQEEQLRRIMEPFYTTKSRGTGLGMAIAHRVVDAHGGVIDVRNHPESGADIGISLPAES